MEDVSAVTAEKPGAPEETREFTLPERFVDGVFGMIFYFRDLVSMFANFWLALFLLRGSQWKYTRMTIVHQIIFSGLDGIKVIGLISAFVGGVVIVQMLHYSPDFQTDAVLINMMVSLIIKELAPILTVLILVGRSGSAITIELGQMKLKRHNEALAAMGIDLFQYFHVPRIIGLSVSNLILNAYFVIITLLSALAISVFQGGADTGAMLELFLDAVKLSDIWVCTLKGLVLGTVIALVCLHHGQEVESSATQIPQQTSTAIVNSFRLSYTLNGVISVAWYLML